jgi:hypothetical protein
MDSSEYKYPLSFKKRREEGEREGGVKKMSETTITSQFNDAHIVIYILNNGSSG